MFTKIKTIKIKSRLFVKNTLSYSKLTVFVLWICVLCTGIPCLNVNGDEANKDMEFIIVKKGKPTCCIVISEHPTPSARLSALELQYHVLKMTGAELPIKNDTQPISGRKILVGDNRFTKELGFKSAEFLPQEYLISFRPDTLILLGRDWEDTELNRGELGRPMNCGNTLADTRHKIDYWQTACPTVVKVKLNYRGYMMTKEPVTQCIIFLNSSVVYDGMDPIQ